MNSETKSLVDDQDYNNAEISQITTERLLLGGLQISDDAIGYINKIMISVHISYWVVRLKETCQPIGIVTKIQRETMQNPHLSP